MPHIQLHATYMLEDMDCFINPMKLTRNHPEIPLLWFVLMRLYVAYKDDFPYCKALNEMMLEKFGIDNETKNAYIKDINKAPLKDKEILLLKKAIKSIYDSHNFN